MIDTAIHQLSEHIQGTVFEPGDAGYADTCTLFNAAIERAPAVVVRVRLESQDRGRGDPRSPAPTAAAGCAKRRPLRRRLVAVRRRPGGRHAVVDCDRGRHRGPHRQGRRRMHDRCGRTAPARPMGWRLSPAGSHNGIAGFTLGGGSGMLERRFGFAVDNLLAVELVTAGGEPITGEPRTPFRAVLGAARGRRQLRRGHVAHLPCSTLSSRLSPAG